MKGRERQGGARAARENRRGRAGGRRGAAPGAGGEAGGGRGGGEWASPGDWKTGDGRAELVSIKPGSVKAFLCTTEN